MTKEKDWDYIARLEKAIAKKYGEEAIQNPSQRWNAEKEKEYLKQLKEIEKKEYERKKQTVITEIDGILIEKKLFIGEVNRTCSLCEKYTKAMDQLYMTKYNYCCECYHKHETMEQLFLSQRIKTNTHEEEK